jgi:hypothetical protein
MDQKMVEHRARFVTNADAALRKFKETGASITTQFYFS